MLLAHDERGSGEAVVLLHAGIADRRMWEEELTRLADRGYRAIAVDLPGFGDSPPAPDLDAPWRDVLETLEELGAERFVLVGNSFGGAVATSRPRPAPSSGPGPSTTRRLRCASGSGRCSVVRSSCKPPPQKLPRATIRWSRAPNRSPAASRPWS